MKLATLCYVKDNCHTLMLQRVKRKDDMHYGKWNGLGGKFEPGESPEECARREIKEESGLDVEQLELKGFLTFPAFAKDEDWYAFVFLARGCRGVIVDPPEGILKWIPDAELAGLPLWEGDTVFFQWLERPEFFSGKFTYVDGRLLSYEVAFYPKIA